MSGMRHVGDTEWVECGSCGEAAEDWAEVTITEVLGDQKEIQTILCEDCLAVLEELLELDFDESDEGYFRVSPLGFLIPHKNERN